METDKLYIKNMVCERCKMAVKDLLQKHRIAVHSIDLGEVSLVSELSPEQKQALAGDLLKLGFELIDDKKSRLILQIKTHIIELVQQHNAQLSSNLSDYLSDKLHLDYNYLSSLFSELENISIEKFFIAQKIEKVKELMIYDELSLSQIADMLQYSSVAYLSNQFKRTTGFSPRQFKQMKGSKRKALDQL